MAWPNAYTLPFIAFETVWRVYEITNPGGQESKTLRCIVCYKDGGTVNGKPRALEYMGFPSNVAVVAFKAASGVLEFEPHPSFSSYNTNNPVPLTGSGSVHTACVSAFGSQYKRFKGTITRDRIHDQDPNADGAFPWTSWLLAPELDPGTHSIVNQTNPLATIGGVAAQYVSGPDVPTSGNDRGLAEAMIVPTVNQQAPATSKFRTVQTSTNGTDPTQYSGYSSHLPSGAEQRYVFVFDPIVISSSWN